MKRKFFGLKMTLSLSFMLIAATFQLTAFSPAQAYTGTLSDLEGTWNFNTLSTGNDVARLSRGQIIVQNDGSYTASGTDIDGNPINSSGDFAITADGLTMSGTNSTNTLCQVDAGKTLIACTQTETDATTTLIVATKEAASCLQADLTGTWQFNRLSAGAKDQWLRSTMTVKNDGTFTELQVNSDGTKKTKTGTLSISPDGVVNVDSCPLCNDTDRNIVMDSGKTLIADTSVKQDSVTAQLGIFSKKAASYSKADLPGTWEMNTLVSGNGSPRWKRATVTINPGGTFTGSQIDSNKETSSPSGKLSITSAGVITCPTCGDSSFKMAMDSGKTSIVGTETPDPGKYQITVLTRNPLTISGIVTSGGTPLAGVTVTLTGSSGTLSSPPTDGTGTYSFGGLLNGKYKVAASRTGYAFTPKSQALTVQGQNVTQNFTGTPITVSGKVIPYTGKNLGPLGQDGITINLSLSGSVASTYTTDSSGIFTFSELANGVYTVTPVPPTVPSVQDHPVLTFVPAKLTVPITGKSAKPHSFKYKTNSSCSKCH
jgi:hypothetical protein